MTVYRIDECAGCGAEFRQVRKHGRPRRRCDSCRLGLKRTAATPMSIEGLRPDPPVRADGCCAVCLKKRRLTDAARTYSGMLLDLDPFCSSKCCRVFHGCELGGEASDSQIEAARNSAALYRDARQAAIGG